MQTFPFYVGKMIKIMQNIGKKRSNKAVFSTFMHYSWYFQWEPLRKALFWGAPQWVRRVVCSGNSVSWLPGHTEWAGSNISGSCFFSSILIAQAFSKMTARIHQAQLLTWRFREHETLFSTWSGQHRWRNSSASTPSYSVWYLTGLTSPLSLLWCLNKISDISANPCVVPLIYWCSFYFCAQWTSISASHYEETLPLLRWHWHTKINTPKFGFYEVQCSAVSTE